MVTTIAKFSHHITLPDTSLLPETDYTLPAPLPSRHNPNIALGVDPWVSKLPQTSNMIQKSALRAPYKHMHGRELRPSMERDCLSDVIVPYKPQILSSAF